MGCFLAFLSSQLLFDLYGSDAVLLSMVLGIPDLVHTYIEAMEIVRDILHVRVHTQWPQGCSQHDVDCKWPYVCRDF